jgi:uncharacterized repeat protein (TIGR01451 family)
VLLLFAHYVWQSNSTTNATSIADVAVRKVVAPAIPGNPRISQTKTVGFVFTFTITVFVNSQDDAKDVVMTDQLPVGLTLESVQDDGACRYTLTTITCYWASVSNVRPRTVIVAARAVRAGTWVNPANVTTTSVDQNRKDNNDSSRVIVQVSDMPCMLEAQ